MLSQALALFLIFAEPGFPSAGLDAPLPFPAGDHVIVAESAIELIEELEPGRILVWRHGGAFPSEAWPALVRFLEAGGRLLHLGGEPFTRPVTGPAGNRVLQPGTVSLLKELNLNRSYRVETGGARQIWLKQAETRPLPADAILPARSWVSILEPRLSDTKHIDFEDGSDGPREGIVRPLSHIQLAGESERFPAAAGAFAIDRFEGRFAGGRWVFRLLSTPPADDELALLMFEASRPVTDSRINPLYGCFHEGEVPTVTLRLFEPGATGDQDVDVRFTLTDPDGRMSRPRSITIRVGREGIAEISFPRHTEPGLYRLRAEIEGFQPTETGWWVMDEDLFSSGDDLTFDSWTLSRNGVPEPVIGSTVMSSTVHRQFLFEPNALVWDETFGEMADIGLNITRTGVWTGFDRIMSNGYKVDEAWLRALEAYYLSARRHGIPVIFTFFAFTPPAWGGVSPYFDPTSIEAQKRYLEAVASRFAGAREMLWDLINEPSFASPDKLWRCRPNGDRYEAEAFIDWLQEQFGDSSAGSDDATWQDAVRTRWRLLPDEEIGLPRDSDFSDFYYLSDQHPYRAMDWLHFAQDAFEVWMGEMTESIRSSGSEAPITVGQDEGGLVERPSPLFHHRAVDFTSMHTWWNNDNLLWDGIMAKAPGTPLLISETGIMQRELLSGESLRDLGGYADLLSRKIGYSFAAGAFGVIEWIYDVNPYMASDNEVAIGLRRVDGSYKPEHRVLREYADFIGRIGPQLAGYAEPDIVMVVPFSGIFGPRDLEIAATRRVVRSVMIPEGARLQAVSEYRTGEDLGSPDLIVLPSTNGISEQAWQDIMAAVEAGAVLHCSGWFELNDAGLPVYRLGAERRPLARFEKGEPTGAEFNSYLEFPLNTVEGGYAADHGKTPDWYDRGAGMVRHFAYPLEWTLSADTSDEYLAQSVNVALGRRGGGTSVSVAGWTPGLEIYPLAFTDTRLLVAINEAAVEQTARFWRTSDSGSRENLYEITFPAGVTRMLLVDHEGTILDCSHDLKITAIAR
ncbi:hypothetical protein ACFL3H_09000 [Gemmatimonadota bacterium]